MKFSNLFYTAYGPFTNLNISFSDSRNFHIILGPNEAGKSSALRGISSLLYKIDGRTSDNFLHEYGELKIGGKLVRRDGNVLEFYRRKGTKNTLLDKKGNALDESLLNGYLPISDPNTFNMFYGLDHRRLREGGDELKSLDGDLAKTLFVATSGISSLRRILETLQNQTAELMPAKRAQRGLNLLRANFKDLHKQMKECTLTARQWNDIESNIQEVDDKIEEILRQECDLKNEKDRLERIKRSYPKVIKLKELIEERDSYESIVSLPDDYPYQKRKEVSTALIQAKSNLSFIEDELNGKDGLRSKLEEISPSDDLLSALPVIENYYRRYETYLKAAEDSTKLKRQVKEYEFKAKLILEQLPFTLSIEDALNDRISQTVKDRIRKLSRRYDETINKPIKLGEEITKEERELGAAVNKLSDLPQEYDIRNIERVLKESYTIGDPDLSLSEKQYETDQLKERYKRMYNSLPYWNGSEKELMNSPFPMLELLNQYVDNFADLQNRIKEVNRNIEEMEETKKQVRTEKDGILLENPVANEQSLREIRHFRDAGWELIKRDWLYNDRAIEEVDQFTKGNKLENVYENAVQKSDDIADQLLTESEIVAKISLLTNQLKSIDKKMNDYENQRETYEEELIALQNDWEDVWRDVNIKGYGSPTEMKEWMDHRSKLILLYDDIKISVVEENKIKEKIEKYRNDFNTLLNEIKGEEIGKTASFKIIRESVSQFIDSAQICNQERRELENRISSIKSKVTEFNIKKETADRAKLDFMSEWTDAIAPIGLNDNAPVEEVESVLNELENLYVELDRIQSHQRRIADINEEAEKFFKEARAFIEKIAPDMESDDINNSIVELHRMLRAAQLEDESRKRISEQIQEKNKKRDLYKHKITGDQAFIDKLLNLYNCSSESELDDVERKWSEYSNILEDIRSLKDDILGDSGGMSLDEFINLVETTNHDEIPGKLFKIESELLELSKQKESQFLSKGELQKERQDLQSKKSRIQVEEEIQSALSEMRRLARKYITLSLAHSILIDELERIKQKSQTPVLDLAGHIFSNLTLDSFDSLGIDYDKSDNPILVGVRSSGEKLAVQGMSDGTVDQLYLSLRLAYIDNSLSSGDIEPMPFIVDDILINFDNERASAALSGLAEFSQKTQIIFFTHHKHLVEIVENSSINDQVEIHDLLSQIRSDSEGMSVSE